MPSNNIEFFNKKYTYCIYTEYNTNYIIFNIDDNLIISKSVLEDDDDTIIYDAYFKLNESLIDEEKSLKEFFLKKNYGLKNFFFKFSEIRCEFFKDYVFKSYHPLNWNIFLSFSTNLLPLDSTIKDKQLININILFLIRSYKGWRHLFNLPAHGQRTWSNGKTVSRIKSIFLESSMHFFKDGLINAHPLEIKNSFLLEKYNLLWFHQWNAEWGYAVDKRNSAAQKQKVIKFEVNTLANLNPNYVRAKKQSQIPIGFEIGYTKFYLKEVKQYPNQNTPNKNNTSQNIISHSTLNKD